MKLSDMRDRLVIRSARTQRLTRKEKNADYFEIPVMLRDSGQDPKSSTSTIRINLRSNNDNPHSAGTKNIQVFNYRVSFKAYT